MRNSVRFAGFVLLGVAAVVFGSSMWRDAGVSDAAGASMSLQPASQVVQAGEHVTVDISVADVADLAAWQLVLKYDPAVLTFESFEQTDWLDSTGRSQQCPSATVDSQHLLPMYSVDVGCGSFNKTPEGPNGSGVVAHLTFTAAATGTSDLVVLKALLANPLSDDSCCVPAVHQGAIKVVPPGSNNPGSNELPAVPTPNPALLTPVAGPGQGDQLTLGNAGSSAVDGRAAHLPRERSAQTAVAAAAAVPVATAVTAARAAARGRSGQSRAHRAARARRTARRARRTPAMGR